MEPAAGAALVCAEAFTYNTCKYIYMLWLRAPLSFAVGEQTSIEVEEPLPRLRK